MAKILLIENNAELRGHLSQVLRDAGHNVREADNGIAALQSFNLHPAALVITDLFVPEMDGIEVTQVLRRQHPHVKILAISGDGLGSAESYLEIARQLGAHKTLTKPILTQDLLETVQELLIPTPLES